tara:strand:+ start:209 stop:781 length:573 start_codon:yes stop_codon:yes gene_type:complete
MIRVVKTDRKDQFNRRIYVDENNIIYVDTNLNDEYPAIHTISPVDGEPCWAIDCVVSLNTTSLKETNKLIRKFSGEKSINREKGIFRGHLMFFDVYRFEENLSEKWIKLSTEQDAPYYGVWINKEEETTVCYCEGDVIIVVPANFEKEMKELKIFHNIEEEEDKRIQFKDSTGKPVQLSEMFSHIINNSK